MKIILILLVFLFIIPFSNAFSFFSFLDPNFELGCVGENYVFRCGEQINESCSLTGNMQVDYGCFDVIDQNNLTIDGLGHKLYGRTSGMSSEYGFKIINSKNITIKNFKIDLLGRGIDVVLSENLDLYNNRITRFIKQGVMLRSNSIDTWVAYNEFEDDFTDEIFDSAAVWVMEGSNHNTIQNNKIIMANIGLSVYPTGIWIDHSNNLKINNNNIYSPVSAAALRVYSSFSTEIKNNTIHDNTFFLLDSLNSSVISENSFLDFHIPGFGAMEIGGAIFSKFNDNNISSSGEGIGFSLYPPFESQESSHDNAFFNNRLEGLDKAVLFTNLDFVENNSFYNNLFNTTNDVDTIPYPPYLNPNDWNVTKQLGKNILGGRFIGGNVWAHPEGQGFSDTCLDNGGDGICDEAFIIDEYNIDYLPLAIFSENVEVDSKPWYKQIFDIFFDIISKGIFDI
ncbi:MAG: NosD domain-containing protein [archaeon]